MLSAKELISFFIHCAHIFSSIPFFLYEIVTWTNFGRKQTLLHSQTPEPYQAPSNNSLSHFQQIPHGKPYFPTSSTALQKKKVRFSKNGQMQKKKTIRSFPCRGSAVGLGARQPDASQQPPAPRAGEHRRVQGSLLTYSVIAFFSEKILRQKSASWCGSNVVGTRT